MARKSRKSRKIRAAQRQAPAAPRATGRQQPRRVDQEAVAEAAAAVSVPAVTARSSVRTGQSLEETYEHVSRDLKRIFVLAIVMFAIVFIAPYVL
ncbi:MAG: hypothetical protein ACK2T6_08970 [Anaerolineae bacterium]|jgi:hypothetical protein